MEKFKITQENEFVTIDEVVLTKDAIATLYSLQESDNAYINEFLETLGNTVCFLLKTKIHWAGSFVTESEELINKLAFLHGNFKELKKPVKNPPITKLEEQAKKDWETK